MKNPIENELSAERVVGPAHPDVDVADIHFDWEVPSRADEVLTFMLDIARGARTSSIRFNIDLAKLTGVDLQRLHDLLAERPKGYQLTYEIAWLLSVSLEQEMPAANLEGRQQKVRELLLSVKEQQL
jgi:hypothetical protein